MCIRDSYWSSRTGNKEGWFYKTREDWINETGLSRREQESSRNILRNIGVISETRLGMPAQLYFKLNIAVLENLLASKEQEKIL